jgi:acyl-CoA thioesterase I
MNPIVTHIVSGDALYSGSLLIVISVLAGFVTKRFLRVVTSLAAIIGFILVILSATPLPFWLYIVWSASVGLWLLVREMPRKPSLRVSLITAATFAGITVTASYLNAAYVCTPRIPLKKGGRVYVVGDSLSAHYTRTQPWPDRLATDHGVDVVNLAQPGANLQSALTQVSHISSTNCLVILLIGGNDILGATTDGQFETDFKRLLAEVQHRSRAVVMFELPLPPFKNRLGAVQRTLSRQIGVTLIPKRRLAYVIGSAESTADGLHLSDFGHEQMATQLWHLMSP